MKMPPEVLRLSGAFFCDYDSDFSATIACDYDSQKQSATIDYDRRKIREKIPGENLSNFRRKIGGFSGLGMADTVKPCRPVAAKTVKDGRTFRAWCKLATPGKRPVQALYSRRIAVLYAAYSVTALASLRNPII
nr:MAG TPA: hypothetical protein [Caudoviricetes sp.]